MSTALMALVQSLATQAQDSGKECRAPAPAAGGRPPAAQEEPRALVPVAGGKTTPEMLSAILKELVQTSTQISSIDKLLADAEVSAPLAGTDAQHWYAISLQAMKWSRMELEQRLQRVLSQLHALIQADSAEASPEEPASPGACEDPAVSGEAPEDPEGGGPGGGAATEADDPNSFAVGDKQNGGSLRVDLEILRKQDPDCCLIVRRIKRLGLDSSARLEEHFGRYGGVRQVLVAHSFERPSSHRKNGRVRPAALGFVVMETAEAVAAVIEAGESHDIGGAVINVQRFEPFSDDLAGLGGGA